MTPRLRLPIALAAALAFAGMADATPAPDYLRTAGASDLYEVKASQMLLATSRNDRLRNLARLMIADHRKIDGAMKAAALESGVPVARPALSSYQEGMLADLRASEGVDRDLLYLTEMRDAHRRDLATHQDYAATGDQPMLRAAAARTVPLVRRHIAALDDMPM